MNGLTHVHFQTACCTSPLLSLHYSSSLLSSHTAGLPNNFISDLNCKQSDGHFTPDTTEHKWLLSRAGHLVPREMTFCTRTTGSWVRPRAYLDVSAETCCLAEPLG